MPSEWLEIVKSVGVPFTFLGAVLWYVGKVMLPKLMAQHDADRDAFLAGIKALTDQAAAERAAFQARPCYWQQPPTGTKIAEVRP